MQLQLPDCKNCLANCQTNQNEDTHSQGHFSSPGLKGKQYLLGKLGIQTRFMSPLELSLASCTHHLEYVDPICTRILITSNDSLNSV